MNTEGSELFIMFPHEGSIPGAPLTNDDLKRQRADRKSQSANRSVNQAKAEAKDAAAFHKRKQLHDDLKLLQREALAPKAHRSEASAAAADVHKRIAAQSPVAMVNNEVRPAIFRAVGVKPAPAKPKEKKADADQS